MQCTALYAGAQLETLKNVPAVLGHGAQQEQGGECNAMQWKAVYLQCNGRQCIFRRVIYRVFSGALVFGTLGPCGAG